MRDQTDRKPAVFLDRDGVLTEERSYVCSVRELHIFSYAKECVQAFQAAGYYAVVITNQSGVARGLFSEDEMKKINRYLMEQTGVDAVYYCPHHVQGIVPEYRIACRCRKPQIGLIEQACRDFPIDLSRSVFVGDRASDILTGQKARLKTVLLESGYGSARLEERVQPDYVMRDLRDVLRLCGGTAG